MKAYGANDSHPIRGGRVNSILDDKGAGKAAKAMEPEIVLGPIGSGLVGPQLVRRCSADRVKQAVDTDFGEGYLFAHWYGIPPEFAVVWLALLLVLYGW